MGIAKWSPRLLFLCFSQFIFLNSLFYAQYAQIALLDNPNFCCCCEQYCVGFVCFGLCLHVWLDSQKRRQMSWHSTHGIVFSLFDFASHRHRHPHHDCLHVELTIAQAMLHRRHKKIYNFCLLLPPPRSRFLVLPLCLLYLFSFVLL